jgi:hypothetical protein
MLQGQFHNPVSVIAFDVDEGWSADASEEIARAVLERARAIAAVLERSFGEVQRRLEILGNRMPGATRIRLSFVECVTCIKPSPWITNVWHDYSPYCAEWTISLMNIALLAKKRQPITVVVLGKQWTLMIRRRSKTQPTRLPRTRPAGNAPRGLFLYRP